MTKLKKKDNPTLLELIEAALKEQGFDGLYNPDIACGCCLDDLAPCGEPSPECIAGYKWTKFIPRDIDPGEVEFVADAGRELFIAVDSIDSDWYVCGIPEPETPEEAKKVTTVLYANEMVSAPEREVLPNVKSDAFREKDVN